MPGATAAMHPRPDHGEESYKGSGKLKGLKAVITGGDSGIGRAVAIAFAREGADVLIAYLNEDQDAKETQRLVEEAGRKAVLVAGDISAPEHCRAIIDRCVKELGGIDILVNNAAHQASFKSIADITDHEWEHTFKVNIHAMFYLTKAAVPHMKKGACISCIGTDRASMRNGCGRGSATLNGIRSETREAEPQVANPAIAARSIEKDHPQDDLCASRCAHPAAKNCRLRGPGKRLQKPPCGGR
jgi:NAD(P)-dependent dehydrogenase (short-subunit alcohol dehydrogenase family)